MADAPSRRSPALAVLAVAGFSLGAGSSRSARASSAAVIGSSVLSVGLTAGVVVGIVVMVRRNRQRRDVFDDSLTMDLMWSGLLTQRGELGLQVGLLAESPAALDQLSDELDRGGGPLVEQLSRATGLSPADLRSAWQATLAEHGPATSQDEAVAVVVAFLARITPQITVSDAVLVDYLTALVQESGAPAESGPTLSWTARWLGVPPSELRAAVRFAGGGQPVWNGPLKQIRDDPDAFLARFATAIEAKHRAAVEARVAELVRQAGPWLPPELGPGAPPPSPK